MNLHIYTVYIIISVGLHIPHTGLIHETFFLSFPGSFSWCQTMEPVEESIGSVVKLSIRRTKYEQLFKMTGWKVLDRLCKSIDTHSYSKTVK